VNARSFYVGGVKPRLLIPAISLHELGPTTVFPLQCFRSTYIRYAPGEGPIGGRGFNEAAMQLI
jgi:hypothetical protein